MRKTWTTGLPRRKNKTGGQSIAVHFPIEEAELLAWAEQQGAANLSYFIREALKYYQCGQSIFPIGSIDELKEAAKALREMRRSYGSNWQGKLIEQRRDDNYFDEEYS